MRLATEKLISFCDDGPRTKRMLSTSRCVREVRHMCLTLLTATEAEYVIVLCVTILKKYIYICLHITRT